MLKESYDIVLLFSGGLDSLLAAKLLSLQGLSVLALKFRHPFLPGLWSDVEKVDRLEHLGVDLWVKPLGEEHIAVVKAPRYGYGSQMNPCIDCRIFFLRRAWELGQRFGAKGLATGEVLGQRPFSQRRSVLSLIEREAGVEGKVIRPLCAKLLPPSRLELEGIVDREGLLGIYGRGRKRQMALAEKLGITDYPSPAGGCLLTDPGYAARVKDALEHDEFCLEVSQLLKLGRHLRIEGIRAVVGRNAAENALLEERFSRRRFLLKPASMVGPVVLVDGAAGGDTILLAARALARYTKAKPSEKVVVEVRSPAGERYTLTVTPMEPHELERYHIGLR